MRKTERRFEKLLRLATLLTCVALFPKCAGLSEFGPTEPLEVRPEMCTAADGRVLMGFSEDDTNEILDALKRK